MKRENYYATEIVRAIDEVKKVFLMCEHFGHDFIASFKKEAEAFDIEALKKETDLESFSKCVTEFVETKMVVLIDAAVKEELEAHDYEKYTDEHHHRKFWNEITLPDIALHILDAYKTLAGFHYTDSSSYSVSIYDLSDEDLCFDTEEEMEDFLEIEDVAPFTAFKINRGGKIDHYQELYSA